MSDSLTKPRAEDAIYDCRHASLQFLVWLTDGSPDSRGAQVTRSRQHDEMAVIVCAAHGRFQTSTSHPHSGASAI
jgi:hypothetical protein